ncbi:MAG: Asp-tRNA(Asn) amidotransferase GatCAB subunit C [Candidatus Altiarchaeota archaeon]
MIDAEEIRKTGVKLIEEFSAKLKDIPETEETHYVVDQKNVRRKDGRGVRKEAYSKKFENLVPRYENGFVVCEKSEGG